MTGPNTSIPPNIPEDVNAELHQCSKYHVDLSKIALYALGEKEGFTETDLNTACVTIHDAYLKEVFPGQDSPEVSKVVVPAPEPPTRIHGMTMQELLRYHVLEFDKGWKDSAGNNQGELDWYPFGFAVLVSRGWWSEGVVFVHCDPENEDDWTSFKAGSCVLPVEDTGMSLFSVLWGDDCFDNIREMAPEMWMKRRGGI